MPNRCLTTLTVSHADANRLKAFSDGIESNNLLSKLIYPQDRAKTKWDIYWGEFELSSDGLVGRGRFFTSYDPPIGAFEEFKNMGFTIIADYICVDDDYLGSWSDGRHNHHDYGRERDCFELIGRDEDLVAEDEGVEELTVEEFEKSYGADLE